MKKIWWGLISALILLLLALVGQSTSAQSERSLYFPETGHWVKDEFLTYYESVTDADILFGDPITEAFPEPDTGRRIQYFEKARLVFDPSAPPELRVKQTPVGQDIYLPGEAPSFTPNSSNCREFSLAPESNYQVCYAFLDFFEAHGGLAQLGYPLSNFEIEGDRVVQYFQNARFEWHPELPAGHGTVVGNLGWEYFRKFEENPALLSPVIDNNLPRTIMALRVHAFVEQAVMPFNGEQTLSVIVQDQYLQPVSDAEVSFTLILPSGLTEEYRMPVTDGDGITQKPFHVLAQNDGVAEIIVTVSYDDIEAGSRSSFRIWW